YYGRACLHETAFEHLSGLDRSLGRSRWRRADQITGQAEGSPKPVTVRAAQRYRREAKNPLSSSLDCPASSPRATSGRWFRRGSDSTSRTLPHAPAFGSGAPKTTRDTRASTRAPAHIAQGSSVTYAAAPSKRQLPRTRAASRNAMISAWAVGS